MTPDIVVIGGGVMGLATAWRLAQGGRAVTLLEADRCGSGASYAALGALVPSVSTRQNALTALQRESLLLYPNFCAELAQFATQPLYERRGRLELLRSAGRRENAHHEVRLSAQQWNAIDGCAPQEVITAAEVAQLEPGLRPAEHGAIHCRITAQVHVDGLVAALRAACERSGVQIREHAEVEDVVTAGDRGTGARVTGVRLANDAATIECKQVLLTAGAHAAQLRTVQDATLTEPARGQSLTLRVQQPVSDRLIRCGAIYVLRRDQNTVVVGATTEHEAGFDRTPTPAARELLFAGAVDLLPELQASQVVEHRSGLRPSSVDLRPYLGCVPGVDGLFAAVGHYKIGVALTPITAAVVSELILTGDCAWDLAPFAPRGQ
ncbi:MAG: FAD-dependent oxidoreductase [Planctomycetota bacterium]